MLVDSEKSPNLLKIVQALRMQYSRRLNATTKQRV